LGGVEKVCVKEKEERKKEEISNREGV